MADGIGADGLTRYGRDKRWMRAHGFEGRVGHGRPGRFSQTPEGRRVTRIQVKARRLGITYREAERMTPRRPRPGFNTAAPRNQEGRFIGSRRYRPTR